MKIKYQEKGYGSMSGSSLLRQIQNEHTPSLDLLIRESVQNSLDAALPDTEKVRIEITEGSFETEDLAPFLQGIEKQLIDKYPGEDKFLAIRDTGTTGLTGPLSLTDVKGAKFGNLQKLIYQIAKSQENEGSGGSWGIGKTVYFRVGNGLVIYYTRILNKEIGQYEERMAATLVEDEEKPSLLTDNIYSTGIAWWGEKDRKLADRDGTVPITDKDEIHRILEVFDLEPLTDNETGTMIIIPYINSEMLLSQTVTEKEAEREAPLPYWKQILADYLEVGLQKWYAPRLDNQRFDGPWLQGIVNHREITKEDFLPFFRLIQTLYNNSPDSPQSFGERPVESEKIVTKSVFNTKKSSATAGTLSFLNVSEKDMNMLSPDKEPSPYSDIDRAEAEENHEPILAYTRKPGMIVSYETDSEWTHSMPKTEPGEFIVALFRSDRNTILADSFQTEKVKTLEDYLRKSENADHMSWSDINLGGNKPSIVRRIRTTVKNKISNRYKDRNLDTPLTRNAGLGRKIGMSLLPPEGSTYWDDRMGGGHGEGGSGGEGGNSRKGSKNGDGFSPAKVTGFQMVLDGDPQYLEKEVRVPVRLSFGNIQEAELSILLNTENGKMNPDKWIQTTGTPFPAWLNGVQIREIMTGSSSISRKSRKHNRKLPSGAEVWIQVDSVFENISFVFIYPKKGEKSTSLQIRLPKKNNCIICAVISYSVSGFEGILDFHRLKKQSESIGDEK